MASAAGPASDLQPLDPFKQARYPVSFAGQKRKLDAYASIQYNHKPQQTSKKRKTTLKPSANDSGKFQLLIRDSNEDSGGQELYKYSGRSSSEKDVYAVLFEPQTRRCVFAPVSSHYIFNLTSTPKEKDASKLQKEYDQIKSHQPIGASSDAEDDLFGDGEDQASDGNSDAEPSVFDWRKFVPRGPSTSPEHTNSNYGRGAMSAQNTPLLSAQGGKSSAPSKPKPQPRSQYEPTKSNHRDLLKPRKLAVSPLVAPTRKAAPPAAAKKQARSEAASLPNIRVDPRSSTRAQQRASATAPKPSRDDHSEAKAEREASQPNNNNYNHSNRSEERDNNHEDADADADAEEPDDLVLDFDSPTVPTKRPSAWGLAAAASSGPISLRSAASSPGSRLGSPALRQNNRTPTADDDDDMGLEIEVPDADAADAEECGDPWARERQEPTKYTFDDGDEEGEDDDGDRDGEEGSREGGGERGSGIGSGGGSARGGDSDVDALELPSPAADTRRNSEVGRRALSPPDEMDEDEMEAEFLQALASDEDNDDAQAGGATVGGGVVAQEESESESEEE